MRLWVRPGIVVYDFLKPEQGAPVLSSHTLTKTPTSALRLFFVELQGQVCAAVCCWAEGSSAMGVWERFGANGGTGEKKKRIGVADSAGDFSEWTVSESFSNPPLMLARDWCQAREPGPRECHVPHRWGPIRYDWTLTACLIFHIKNTVMPHKTRSRKSNNAKAP